MDASSLTALEFRPLGPETWEDLELLFGERGAYGGCWCMWWHETRKEFERRQGEANRRALRARVDAGEIPGILAYADGRPVGWCSVAPRESYASLERSPVLKRLDERPVWSIVCLFVERSWRGRGVSAALVHAAVVHARERGAEIVEAYPTAPRGRTLPPVSAYMGVPSIFEDAGFEWAAQPSKARVVMRWRASGAGQER